MLFWLFLRFGHVDGASVMPVCYGINAKECKNGYGLMGVLMGEWWITIIVWWITVVVWFLGVWGWVRPVRSVCSRR